MINKIKELEKELENWKKISHGAIHALRGKVENWELEQLFEAYNLACKKDNRKEK